MKYKIREATEFSPQVLIGTTDNGEVLHIPMDESNSDYQRYLRWLENPEAEQSTPSVTNGD